MKRLFLLLFPLFLLLLPLTAGAKEAQPIPISTPDDLAAMAQDPTGHYVLTNDLDMTGIEWKSLDFSGTLDGQGHAILNLTLSEPSDTRLDSVDGNCKFYETTYVGLFGTLTDAEVKDLKLINVRGLVESDEPVFLAALAGYCRDSSITGCTVTATLELRAHDRMFGVGGVIGYGSGLVENCDVDVTLICVDTDASTRDEQFLGGVFATGFVDVLDSTIHIQGYSSEHGYAHNGGITGMLMQYPLAVRHAGYITGNQVTGFITFFEDNTDRRAYCAAYCGEILAYNYYVRDNTEEFTRDERKEYDVELRPEMCPEPLYSETVVPGTCDTYGYTEYTCPFCAYTFRDRYTPFLHTVTDWTVDIPATQDAEGRSTGLCDGCGIPQERTDPTLPPPPPETEAPTTAPTAAPEPEQEAPSPVLPIATGVLVLAALSLLLFRKKAPKKR